MRVLALSLLLAGSAGFSSAQTAAAASAQELNDTFQSGLKAMAAKDYESAIASFSRASVIDPKQDAVWAQLAEAYLNAAREKPQPERPPLYQKALDAYSRAVSLKPADPSYRNNYGLALAEAGRVQEARAAFESAVKLDPAKAPMYFLNLGIILHRAGRNHQAIKALQQIPESASEFKGASWLLSVVTVSVYLDSAKQRFKDLKGKQEITDADARKIAAENNSPVDDIGTFVVWDSNLTVPGASCSIAEFAGSDPLLECAFDTASTVQELRASYDTLIAMVDEALKPLPSRWSSTETEPEPTGALKHVFRGPGAEVQVDVHKAQDMDQKTGNLKVVYRTRFHVIAH